MAETVSIEGPPYVDAIIKYPERTAEGGRISGNKEFTFELEDHRMRIRNARLAKPSFGVEGFALLNRTTDIDFTDEEDVKKRWHPQARRLVGELTGAKEVLFFLGILRGGEEELGGGPALMAHVDFNAGSLREWAAKLAPDHAADLVGKRLINVNLWTPVRPVENFPLGVCDATSIEAGDFMNIKFGKEETIETDTFRGGFELGRLRPRVQSSSPLVLLSPHAAERGPGVQALRHRQRRPADDRPHRVRGSDIATGFAPAHELRASHDRGSGLAIRPRAASFGRPPRGARTRPSAWRGIMRVRKVPDRR